MACKKYTVSNTGTTTEFYSYRKCDNNEYISQVALKPGQTRNFWIIEDTLVSTGFEEPETTSSVFPITPSNTRTPTPTPTLGEIVLSLSPMYSPGSVVITYFAKLESVNKEPVTMTFVDNIETVNGETIVVKQQIVIPAGSLYTTYEYTLDGYDYENLTGKNQITDLVTNTPNALPSQVSTVINEAIPGYLYLTKECSTGDQYKVFLPNGFTLGSIIIVSTDGGLTNLCVTVIETTTNYIYPSATWDGFSIYQRCSECQNDLPNQQPMLFDVKYVCDGSNEVVSLPRTALNYLGSSLTATRISDLVIGCYTITQRSNETTATLFNGSINTNQDSCIYSYPCGASQITCGGGTAKYMIPYFYYDCCGLYFSGVGNADYQLIPCIDYNSPYHGIILTNTQPAECGCPPTPQGCVSGYSQSNVPYSFVDCCGLQVNGTDANPTAHVFDTTYDFTGIIPQGTNVIPDCGCFSGQTIRGIFYNFTDCCGVFNSGFGGTRPRTFCVNKNFEYFGIQIFDVNCECPPPPPPPPPLASPSPTQTQTQTQTQTPTFTQTQTKTPTQTQTQTQTQSLPVPLVRRFSGCCTPYSVFVIQGIPENQDPTLNHAYYINSIGFSGCAKYIGGNVSGYPAYTYNGTPFVEYEEGCVDCLSAGHPCPSQTPTMTQTQTQTQTPTKTNTPTVTQTPTITPTKSLPEAIRYFSACCCSQVTVFRITGIPQNQNLPVVGSSYNITGQSGQLSFDGCATCISRPVFFSGPSFTYNTSTISTAFANCIACTGGKCKCKLNLTYASTTTTADFFISGSSAFTMTVSWGDNITTTYSGSTSYTPTHDYTGSTIRNAVVTINDCPAIRTITFNVNNLTGGSNGLTNITGLPCLTNLITLDLSYNQLTTFDPEGTLSSSLTTLNLSHNLISTFNPTYQLPNSIRTLNLSNNSLTTFDPTNHPLPSSLLTLNLAFNDIGPTFDPSIPLPNNLFYLYLNNNEIYTFDPSLALSTNLHVLNLNYNFISNFDPTIPLPTALTTLSLCHNELTGFNPQNNPITNLVNLKYLYLCHNNITNFDPDPALPNSLLVLDLSYNPIPVFDPVNNPLPTSLQTLLLQGCLITNFDPTIELPCLITLNLGFNNITNFDPQNFRLPTCLITLYLNDNEIDIFDPFYFPLPDGLRNLYLQNNNLGVGGFLFDPSHYALPNGLRLLHLGGNGLDSFDPTTYALPNLTTLNLSNNDLTFFDPVNHPFPLTLIVLDLSDNQISRMFNPTWNPNSVTPNVFQELYLQNNLQWGVWGWTLPTTMTILDLSFNQITDFTSQVNGGTGLPIYLEELYLQNNLISAFRRPTQQLPTTIKNFNISNNSIGTGMLPATIFTNPSPSLVEFKSSTNALLSNDINVLYTNLETITRNGTSGVITIELGNQPATGAGLTAKTTLTSRGWTCS